jgi:transcription initiation factor TFIIE subunit alpha
MDPVDDLLKDPAIRAYLHRLVKDEGLNLIERFPRSGEHSDEDLAAKTGINLNSVRHTLYTLYEKRLAEYHRIKNNETGWLTYLWQLRTDNIFEAIREDMELVLEKLERRGKYEEENDFFICKDCQVLFTFPQAMNLDFNCPSCGKAVSHFDNDVLLKSLKERIGSIKKSLGHAVPIG